jgi:glycerophosphoryl diester phosphodiesterase
MRKIKQTHRLTPTLPTIMKPLIIAHRGTSADAPENTLIAFKKSIEIGADGIEFDVRLSKDNVPMVIHDGHLRRTGNLDAKVKDLTAEELQKIDVGKWFSEKFVGETVPTLTQVFDLFKDNEMRLYVELKCKKHNYQEYAKAVAEVIKQYDLLARMVVLSFEHQALVEIKKHLPDVKTGALFSPKLLSFFRVRRKFIKTAQELEANEIAPHYSMVTKGTVENGLNHNIKTIVWTANKIQFLEKAIKIGLFAVMTNHPQMFLERRAKLL